MRMPVSLVAGRAAHCRAALPNHVVARSFVSETVLLDVHTGRYFKLDASAGSMLDAILAGRTIAQAAGRLADEGWGSEDAVVSELAELCSQLERLGLLRLQAAAA